MFPSSRRLIALIAGLVALAVSTCSVPAASAGEYDVWSCRGPAGQPLSSEAWVLRENDTQAGDIATTDDCLTGGPMTLTLTSAGTLGRKARVDATFDLPRGAKITDFLLRRAGSAAGAFGPPYNYVTAVREVTGGTVENWGCASYLAPPYYNCSIMGAETDPDDPSNVHARTGVNLDQLGFWIGCDASGGCNPPFAPPAARFVLFESKVTVADNVSPVVNSTGGTLTGPDPVTRPANLFVRATDDNAGIESMELEIDGVLHQAIDPVSPDCVEPFVTARPCPADAGRVFTVDPSTLSEGTHVATGSVIDAAGNETTFGPVGFTVADPDGPGPPPPDNGVPAVAEPTIALASGSVTHVPGRVATVEGRLTTSTGVPVAGAVLGARSTPLAVSNPVAVSLPDVTTGADGGFSIPVPGQGARQVEISFAPSAGSAVTSTSRVRVSSRLGLTLKARPKKVRIKKKATFTGRLTGAGPSAAGTPVEIQAKVQGKWETVANVTANAAGSYKWTYRFRFVKRKAIFSFRALVRRVPGWPWPAVSSKTAKVRITMGRR